MLIPHLLLLNNKLISKNKIKVKYSCLNLLYGSKIKVYQNIKITEIHKIELLDNKDINNKTIL